MFGRFEYELRLTSPEDNIEKFIGDYLTGVAVPHWICPEPGDLLLFEMYSFHPPKQIFDAIINLAKNGVHQKWIFERSQAVGKVSKPLIEELAATPGVEVRIGTSMFHEFTHLKRMIRLHTSKSSGVMRPYLLLEGSYNWSKTAQKQDNSLSVNAGYTYFKLIQGAVDRFNKHWEWITKNEPQYQIGPDGKLPVRSSRVHHSKRSHISRN